MNQIIAWKLTVSGSIFSSTEQIPITVLSFQCQAMADIPNSSLVVCVDNYLDFRVFRVDLLTGAESSTTSFSNAGMAIVMILDNPFLDHYLVGSPLGSVPILLTMFVILSSALSQLPMLPSLSFST